MATTDISALIDYYVREKDLTRERVIQALEASFITAYSKKTISGYPKNSRKWYYLRNIRHCVIALPL